MIVQKRNVEECLAANECRDHWTAHVGYWSDGHPVLVIQHDKHGNTAIADLNSVTARALGTALTLLADAIEEAAREDAR